jgi:uncharacterized protein YkwD
VRRTWLALTVGSAAVLATAIGAPAATAGKSACARYGDTSPTKLTREEAAKSVRCLLNRRREQHDLHRLSADRRLDRAAQRHTEYMRRHHCFSHRCRGERSLRRRLERVNYIEDGLRRWAIGENIGWGTGDLGTPKEMVSAWMHSPGHRHNILDRSFRDLGVGFVQGTPSNPDANGGIYTTDFGLRVK